MPTRKHPHNGHSTAAYSTVSRHRSGAAQGISLPHDGAPVQPGQASATKVTRPLVLAARPNSPEFVLVHHAECRDDRPPSSMRRAKKGHDSITLPRAQPPQLAPPPQCALRVEPPSPASTFPPHAGTFRFGPLVTGPNRKVPTPSPTRCQGAPTQGRARHTLEEVCRARPVEARQLLTHDVT